MLLRPGLRDGATLAFLLGVWNGGELLVLSLYMQQVLHFSPLATGLIIAPQGIAGFSMGMLGPKLAGRFGVRRVAMLAGVSASIGFAVLTQLPAAGYSPLLTVVILVGFGGAGTAFGSIVLASRELSDGDQGLAGGVVNTSRQMGAAVGAALLPAVAESVSGVSGDRAAMLTATGRSGGNGVSWHAARQASSCLSYPSPSSPPGPVGPACSWTTLGGSGLWLGAGIKKKIKKKKKKILPGRGRGQA